MTREYVIWNLALNQVQDLRISESRIWHDKLLIAIVLNRPSFLKFLSIGYGAYLLFLDRLLNFVTQGDRGRGKP